MTIFEFISVALSFVIGLGIARLLTAVVELFRARKTVRLHWMPFVWAALVFLWMIQYWWAIFELSLVVESWEMWRFAFLLLLALLLFAAAALILPTRPAETKTDLLEDFQADGRWALIVMVSYFLVAVTANTALFGLALTAPLNLLTLSLTVLPLVFLFSKNYRVQTIVTLLSVPLNLYAFLKFSPNLY
ncbi:MAG: hypothetical protein OER80_03320 [Gammaproteobacteria bacterium]|nr:hypothetical protein [Gammaproteobacteria bacterium]